METDNAIKILLVDDEVKFLQAVAQRLSIKGFNVTTATDGDAAVAAANKGGFDVAVVDLQMPGTDGAQVLKILKQNHKFIEIIMLTGHATVDSAVECTKLGHSNTWKNPTILISSSKRSRRPTRPGCTKNSKAIASAWRRSRNYPCISLRWVCSKPWHGSMTTKNSSRSSIPAACPRTVLSTRHECDDDPPRRRRPALREPGA